MRQFCTLAMLALMLGTSGCAALGVVAHAIPPPAIKPDYTGLAGQTVGVMVWADRGIRIDFPTVRLDLANAIQARLANSGKAKEMLGTSFPVSPASIVRYQEDHPETHAMPITDVAPRLGVSRLIYVELEDFATRSDMSVQLFRGSAKATAKVIEVNDGQAKVALDRNGIEGLFPKKSPREGVPNAGDAKIYMGLIDAFATEVSHQFLPYEPEE